LKIINFDFNSWKVNYFIIMNKRKREDTKKELESKEDIHNLGEAIEEELNIEDEEKSASSEGEGEDLMQDMEK
jgi:hypothetical protein